MLNLEFNFDKKKFHSRLKKIAKNHPKIARKILKNVGSGVFDISRNKYIKSKTGKLGSKFYTDAYSTTDAWLINRAKHGAIQEFGGIIRSKKGKVLHFSYQGTEMFRRSVYIKPKKYFISAIDEMMHSKGLNRIIDKTLNEEHKKAG